MKTYNQFLNTPFSEEVKPEPPEEDNQIASKQKRQMQIKKQVLLKKMQAVRAGAGADIVAGYEPEGEELKEYSPNVTYQAKGGKKSGKLGKSSVYSLKDKGESKKEFRKSQVKDIKGGYLKTEEVVNEGDVHSGQGEKIQKRTKKWMDKKGMKGAPGLDAMKARTAEHEKRQKASRGVKEEKDAYKYVVSKLKKQYGDGVLTKGDKMPEPSAAQKKKNAAIRAKRAKEDHRDATEKASSGRYNDRSRSD